MVRVEAIWTVEYRVHGVRNRILQSSTLISSIFIMNKLIFVILVLTDIIRNFSTTEMH